MATVRYTSTHLALLCKEESFVCHHKFVNVPNSTARRISELFQSDKKSQVGLLLTFLSDDLGEFTVWTAEKQSEFDSQFPPV